LVTFTPDFYFTPHSSDQLSGNGQSQTASGGFGGIERIEDFFPVLIRDTLTLIHHFQPDSF
jgi:hypothetical protein